MRSSSLRLFAVLLACALPLSAGTVKVRLWWQHPPQQIRLTSGGQAEWRSCASCPPRRVAASLEAKAENQRVSIGGLSVPKVLLRGRYELAVESAKLQLNWPAEIGAVRGRLVITVTMPIEEYVAGVLAGEAGGIRQDEPLNALAVAARSYAVHFGSRHAAEGFDLCDTTHCQDLRLSAISQKARDAAARTEGELVWYAGKPAATYYHRSCGGAIEDGRALLPAHSPAPPYLRAHADGYCVRAGADEWRGEVSKRDLELALRNHGIAAPRPIAGVSVVSRTAGGRAQSIRLAGGGATTTVDAGALRLAVGRNLGWELIRSDAYQITDLGDRLVFFGRGQGHGIGLCQAGASVMAADGYDYREILRYYYPGTAVGITAQALHWTLFADDRLELLTTSAAPDRQLLASAARALQRAEQRTGWTMPQRPQLRVYPSVAVFRDSTGEPGWVAASTRGRVIRLQPAQALLAAGTLDSTLRHEFAHILVEAHAAPALPLWFREGLVLWTADGCGAASPSAVLPLDGVERALRAPVSQAQLRRAYAQACERVSKLVEQHGKARVLNWAETAPPGELSQLQR